MVESFDTAGSDAQPDAPLAHQPREGKLRKRTQKPGRGSSRTFWVFSAIALGAALLTGAVVVGWGAANSLAVASDQRSQAETKLISLPDYSIGDSVSMPDVRGLSEEDATQALVDAGVPASIVTVLERSSAGAPGRVIQQTPVFGVTNPGLVTIVISTEAVVPKVVGEAATTAVDSLQALGARVEQVRVYEPGATVGNVTATEPKAGEALPEVVTVYIADTPSTRLLDDFDSVSGYSWAQTDYVHLGIKYDTAHELSARESEYADASIWDLEAKATTLEGAVALPEDSESGHSVVVIVVGDGSEIGRVEVGSTAPVPVSWDLRGVSTLSITAVATGSEDYGSLVLLDAKVLGSFDQMNASS